MKHKLILLTPVLCELTCDKCGGTIKFKRSYETKTDLFKKPITWYEYECTECGIIEKLDKRIYLKQIAYVDEKTHVMYARSFDTGVYRVNFKE